MPIDSGNLALKGLDDLFSTEENRQEEQREQVQQIPIDELHPFTNHPLTPIQITPKTRAILRFPPMCRTKMIPRTSRTPNPSDFKAAFAAVHIQMKTDWRERLFQF